MNQFEINDMCIKFVINNVSLQGRNVNIKLNLKLEEICRDRSPMFCEINDNVPGFCLVLSEAHLPCEIHNMECFAKIING